jgi:predicted nucleic acid-binding protein
VIPDLLDTNILLRHILKDVPDQAARVRGLVARLERGEAAVFAPDTIIFECLYVLNSIYAVPRGEAVDAIRTLLGLPTVVMYDKPVAFEALHLFEEHPRLGFADCFHAALATIRGTGTMLSFDRGVERLPGLRRIEP